MSEQWHNVQAVPAVVDRSGKKILVNSLENMSHIDIRSFYGRYGSVL